MTLMARLSIYVRDDLKQQIDEAGDTINWSEVVRPAITAALAAHKHRKDQNVSSAIERLRASKQESDQDDRTTGHIDGRTWAENDAEYAWLRRLANNSVRAHAPSGALFRAIDPNDEMDNSELGKICFGDDDDDRSDTYIEGFIEGAVEFFEQVRNQI
jgi:Arc/MetJ-type ribon-helix-helix transcriptional regulator